MLGPFCELVPFTNNYCVAHSVNCIACFINCANLQNVPNKYTSVQEFIYYELLICTNLNRAVRGERLRWSVTKNIQAAKLS